MPLFLFILGLYFLLELTFMLSFIDEFGFFWALIEVILTIFIGSGVIRKQFQNLSELEAGQPVDPQDLLMAIMGGIFLVIPGIFTDICGVMMGWSFFRDKMAELFTRTGAMDYTKRTVFKDRFYDMDHNQHSRDKSASKNDQVIDADFREVDDK